VRKKTLTVLVIAGLLLSIVGMQFVDVAKANPIGVPPNLPSQYPSLTITIPMNDSTFYSNSITLKFTAITPTNDQTAALTIVSCFLDGKLVKAYDYGTSYYSLTLGNLTDGQHQVEVWNDVTYHGLFMQPTLRSGSSTVNFTIQTHPQQSSTPIVETTKPTPIISQTPTPSPSPNLTETSSPSSTLCPTLQPTLEPSITSNPIIDSNNILVILVIAIPILFLIISLAVYFRKKKK
jgi:hypothetical protein